MIKEVWYAIQDIKKNIVIYILFVLELIFSFMLLNDSIAMFDILINSKKGIEKIDKSNVYIVKDNTQTERLDAIFSNSEYDEKEIFLKIFQSINSKKIDMYINFAYSDKNDNGEINNFLYTNNKLFDLFNIKISEGRKFSESDYSYNNVDVIPVVVGYNLRNRYPIGKKIEFYDIDYNKRVGEVIGILNKGSFYEKINTISYQYYLDEKILIPFNKDAISNSDKSVLYSIFTSSVFFTNNRKEISNIVKYANESGQFNFELKKTNEIINESEEYMVDKIMKKFKFFVLILAFCLLGMISSLLLIIDNYVDEVYIHILCGASKKDIKYRFLIQTIFIFCVSFLPIVYFNGLVKSVLQTFIFACIICMIIMLISTIYIYKKNIVEEIKNDE